MQRLARRPGWLAALLAAALLVAWLPGLSLAQDDEDEEEDEEPSMFMEYLAGAGNHAAGGLNGLITWPADPVMATVEASETFPDWPSGPLMPLKYPTAFMGGTLQGVYRLTMGVLDVGLCWVPGLQQLRPVPRYKVVPHEHPDE